RVNKWTDLRSACAETRIVSNGLMRGLTALNCGMGGPETRNNHFEPITLIPMDLDAIMPEMMSEEEKRLLNEYHALVYEKVSPYLEEEEKEWLKKYTRAI
ncbi:M24 family metallopeptidase C-terminal domain-containing protein, partial [Faecalicatena contorta]|uniref:M24 family metallopeptidase C-terminal domain-containing protein n=1 Tax=Faecalicatena contorta TaxID=39482 RepID=UPI001F3642DC